MKDTITLKSDKLKLVVSPKVGGSILSMEYKYNGEWVHIMRPTPISSLERELPGDFASFNMIPFSNRIENGILKFKEREYILEINNPDGHTIHGEVRNKALNIKSESSTEAIMSFCSEDFDDISWPFPFYSEVGYRFLDENTISIDMILKNIGMSTMPGGMGIHPYFMRKLSDSDEEVILTMPIKGIYPGEDTIPTGHYVDVSEELDFSDGKVLTDDFLDNCFALGDSDIAIKWPGSNIILRMEKDSIFTHGIIYCPQDDKDFFAIEPVTNCNNAFNMVEMGIEDTGTIYIEPGESIKGSIKIQVKKV